MTLETKEGVKTMATVEERFAAVTQALEAAGGDISTKLRTLTKGVAANSMAIEELEEVTRSLTAETRERIEVLEAAVKALTAQPAPAETPSAVPERVLLDVLRPDGCTIPPRPGTAKFSTLEIVKGQVVHRGGSAYVAAGSSVLADHADDWYDHIRLDAIAATIIASRSVQPTAAELGRVDDRAWQWLRTDLRRTLDTGGSNGVAVYTHLAGLYFAAGKLGIDLASEDLTRHTNELTVLLERASFRPNHNFRTGSLLLLASYLSASSAATDKGWATWADLWHEHLATILKTSGANVVDVHSATHNSGRGMHYTVMSLSGYLTGEAIMRTVGLPNLDEWRLEQAVETPWDDILRWAKKDTWTSNARFEWIAANGVRYNDNGAVNHDLVSFVSHQAAALGYNVPTYGTPKPTPYWSHTMPLTAAK